MKEQDINIAISEHLKLPTLETVCQQCWGTGHIGFGQNWPCPNCEKGRVAPYYIGLNYCGDLNFLRPIELSLSDEEYSFFEERVLDLLTEELPTVIQFGLKIPVGRVREMSASALVRAKAILGLFENRKAK